MYENPYTHLAGEIADKKINQAGFQEHQYDTGEVILNYVVGPNNGDPLILIPAQMGIWESYAKVMIPLSKDFQVYVIEIRGHGKSSWTPGNYSWATIGMDMKKILEEVVQRKAILSGSSSGGIIALWCAANVPHAVKGLILEDAPVFSAEMPRFKETDRFVYNGLKNLVENIGDLDNRNLADYFRNTEIPTSNNRTKKVPEWFIKILSKQIAKYQTENPGKPVEVGFPDTLRLVLKSLSMFDPDFARAFVDGRFYEGMDHAEALKSVQCPMLVLHADWKRYPEYGLVGAMDDQDAQRIQKLVPQAKYRKIAANHVIHVFKPKEFIEELVTFSQEL